jgi:two-component system, NtrC family, response regulator HydG
MASILLVDDEESPRATLALLLKQAGHDVEQADGVDAAARALAAGAFDLVITDLRMPVGSGLDVVRLTRTTQPDAEVIVLTAYAGWESAKEAMRLGAFDYFEKGREPDELFHRIDQALETKALRRDNEHLRRQVQTRYSLTGIVARSPEMQRVLALVARVAPSDATVLIQGESGTGKELIAKAIHQASPRAPHAFVAVNCAALPEPLLESEIFGHVKGAFTGAVAAKRGLLEEAQGGTFFLDEIGEMPPSVQVKLLRALQEREIRRVGATQPIVLNVRIVAATNRDLAQAIRDGRFREDLYYRLNVVPVVLPPLRERREDIPLLAEHFLSRASERHGRALRLAPAATARLLSYAWPGNVRELENAIERASILANGELVGPEDLPPHIASGAGLGPAPTLPAQQNLAGVEKAHILQTLERCGWNHSRAAEALGIGRTTLWRKLKEYGLE